MSDEDRPVGGAVVSAAVDLFETQGYDQTSVEQIARAAGVSRSTFFRHFGGKDDVVFADHEVVLEALRAHLVVPQPNPWRAVCDAALAAFDHFAADVDLARRRYRVVREVPSLRAREIVAVFGYERLFADYLQGALPGIDPVDPVTFAAAVTAAHNHVLRRLIRGDGTITRAVLAEALDVLLHRFGVHPDGEAARDDDVVVAVFPRRMSLAEVTRRLRAGPTPRGS